MDFLQEQLEFNKQLKEKIADFDDNYTIASPVLQAKLIIINTFLDERNELLQGQVDALVSHTDDQEKDALSELLNPEEDEVGLDRKGDY